MKYRFTLNNANKSEKEIEDPVGWDEVEINLIRDREKHGIHRELELDLQYHCNDGGYDFIDDVISNQGVEGNITLKIEAKCGPNDYITVYEGLLDLYDAERTDVFYNVVATEKGFYQKFDNRFDQKVNIERSESLDGSSIASMSKIPYTIFYHAKQINYKGEHKVKGDWDDGEGLKETTPQIAGAGDVRFSHAVEATERSLLRYKDMTSIFQFAGTLDNPDTGSKFDWIHDEDIDYIVVPWINYQISWNFKFDVNISKTTSAPNVNFSYDKMRFRVLAGPDLANIRDSLVLFDGYGTGGTVETLYEFSVTENGSATKTFQRGDKLWFIIEYLNFEVEDGGGVEVQHNYQRRSSPFLTNGIFDLSITGETLPPDSRGNGYAIHEAGSKLVQIITDQTNGNGFKSKLLGRTNSEPTTYDENGCLSFTAITNGFELRGADDPRRPPELSLKEFYESVDTAQASGIGVEKRANGEDRIRLEDISYFYNKDNKVITLSNVDNISYKRAKELYYNTIIISWNNWANQENQNLDEFNSVRRYSTIHKGAVKQIESTAPFIAGGYSIEFTRRIRFSKDNEKDSEYDENVFIIALNRSTDANGNPNSLDTPEQNENYEGISNLIDPSTTYNLRFSPARCLIRKLRIINAGYLNNVSDKIKFISGEGNVYMTSESKNNNCRGDYSGDPLDEDQDIESFSTRTRDDEETPLWEPEFIEFEHKLDYNQFNKLYSGNNRYGVIEIGNTGELGYIMDIKYRPNDGMANFLLLKAH